MLASSNAKLGAIVPSGIIVEGRLRQDRWEKDGKTQSRVRIAANNVHFLPRKKDDSSVEVPNDAPVSDDIAWDD